MGGPAVPFSVWIWAAFDPVLIGVAIYLGWRASQPGKVFIAAIAALGISLIVGWLFGLISVPWIAPLLRDGPTLIPVRSVAALVWSAGAFAARRVIGSTR